MAQIDNLSTLYSVVDNYSDKVDKMSKKTDDFGKSIDKAIDKAGKFSLHLAGNFVRSTLHALEAITALGAAVGLGAFTEFTKSAIEEAAKIERLTQTFVGLTHSVKEAADIVSYLKDFAKQSVAEFDDLADVARLLQAGGLEPRRLLTTLQEISYAGRGTKEELYELAGAFTRIRAGETGEALEALRRFGISSQDLGAFGIKFDKSNHALSDATSLFAAIEAVAHQKLGGIGDNLEKILDVKFSNLDDAWKQLLASFGQAWFPVVNSILDSLTGVVNFLTESGIVDKISQSFASLFDSLKDGGWVRAILYGVNLIARIPDLLRASFDFLKQFAKNLAAFFEIALSKIIEGARLVFVTFKKISDILGSLSERLGLDVHGTKGLREKIFPEEKDPRFEFEKIFSGLPDIGHIFSENSIETNKTFADFQEFLKKGPTALPDPKSFSFFSGEQPQLAEIANNTKDMVRYTADWSKALRAYVVGGGPIGQIGITPVELGAAFSNRPKKVQVEVHGAGQLEDWFVDIVQQVVSELQRQHGFSGGAF